MTAQPASSELTKESVTRVVKSALIDMVVHASVRPDEEIVGAVLADGRAWSLRNEGRNRKDSFVVGAGQLTDLDVVAVYHSHPDGPEYPSVTDEKGMSPIPVVIITPTTAILWWYEDHIGYYRIWDNNYGVG